MASPNHGAVNLKAIAQRVMQARGFLTDFSAAALREADRAAEPSFDQLGYRDLSGWLWSSIDNDDSRDLDQIEFAQKEPGGTRVYIAIAQVDRFVPKGSALDVAAQHNTTSIYTGVQTFPMLPERLSTDLSSLVEGQKRAAVVFEILVTPEGKVPESTAYPAIVMNRAQLAYDGVAAWLEKGGAVPPASEMTRHVLEKIRASRELQEQLALQDAAAQALRERRHESGALTLQTIEFRPEVTPQGVVRIGAHTINRATQRIEDLMITANQASVRLLLSRHFPTFPTALRTR